MKRIRVVELLANIKANFVAFLSIAMFVALGIGLFLGIEWGAVALRNAENEAREKGKPLTFTKEPIPLNSVTKISAANQMNVKNAVIFSICSDRMEEQL